MNRNEFTEKVLASKDGWEGAEAVVTLNGATLRGTVEIDGEDLILALVGGTNYFGATAVTIFSPLFNNFTPHVLEGVRVTRNERLTNV